MTASLKSYQHQKDMKTKEQWIDETMESLDGVTGARADLPLFGKIEQRIDRYPFQSSSNGTRLFLKVAAGLAILVTINVFTALNYSKNSGLSQTTTNPLANEYFTYIETINF